MLVVRFTKVLIFTALVYEVSTQDGSLESDTNYESGERLGPSVAQVARHPYVASVLKNNSYECSAVIINNHWLLTMAKCFNTTSTHTYIYQRDLANYTIRVGSSYNHKGGSIYKIKILITNFDLQVTAVKAHAAIEFGPGVESANLPPPDAEPSLGSLAMMVAWTPSGHLRSINAPVIAPSICDDTSLQPGQYICVGGVQDPDRHFCRKDTGGAVVQNNTLIGITTFGHSCALYARAHAYPKLSSFSVWLDSVIWDESDRPTSPTTTAAPTTVRTTEPVTKTSYIDYQEYTIPFDQMNNNMHLEPLREDNLDAPRISMYEAYLQHLERARTSTSRPNALEDGKREALMKLNKVVKMLQPPPYSARKYDLYDYND